MYDWPTKNAAFRYVKFPFSILQTEIFQQRTNEPFRPLFSRGVETPALAPASAEAISYSDPAVPQKR